MADRVNELLAELRGCGETLGCCGCKRVNSAELCLSLVAEAADVLQEYVDRCARYANEVMGLREKQRWIPVTERLPSKNGSYIVHCDDSCEPSDERIWGDSVVVEASWFFGAWSWNENANEYDLDGIVTHWMPLPDAPEVTCDG